MEKLIALERHLNDVRHEIPDITDLDESRRLICQAQNHMQKHIEKTSPVPMWKHVKTVAPSQSTYNLIPANVD
jgi:hypothetical protein